jgi:hypothetical protein
MAIDSLERLAELPVPPVPPSFSAALHHRINKRLLMGQFLDLATRGFAFAILHLARAGGELLRFTVTGKFEPKPDNGSRPAP